MRAALGGDDLYRQLANRGSQLEKGRNRETRESWEKDRLQRAAEDTRPFVPLTLNLNLWSFAIFHRESGPKYFIFKEDKVNSKCHFKYKPSDVSSKSPLGNNDNNNHKTSAPFSSGNRLN